MRGWVKTKTNTWRKVLLNDQETIKKLAIILRKSGFKIILWTVSTLEGGGSIMLPTLYKRPSLRFWLDRNARAYTSARSIGFCVIWVCISSSSSSSSSFHNENIAKALFRSKRPRRWGHAIARGWATLLLDRLGDFAVVPSSAGGNSSFELHSQSTEECATFDRYHHFHGHSGMCAWLALKG